VYRQLDCCTISPILDVCKLKDTSCVYPSASGGPVSSTGLFLSAQLLKLIKRKI